MVVSKQQFSEVVSKLSCTGDYGIDTETTGLQWQDRLFSIIIAANFDTYYFNFNGEDPRFPDLLLPKEWIKEMAGIFANPNSTFYIHNAKFDWHMLNKEGVELEGRVVCSYARERILKNNHYDFGSDSYTLAGCARRIGEEKSEAVEDYIDKFKLYENVKIPGKKKLWKNKYYWKVPLDIMAPYGAKDAQLHLKLGRYHDRMLKEKAEVFGATKTMRSLWDVAENEVRLTKTCRKMEARGVTIDVPYTKQALSEESATIDHWKEEFQKLTGLPFNDGRTTLVDAFTRLGLSYPTTDKGNPSFSDASLEGVDNPVAEVIRNIRTYEKRVGTYYASFLHYLAPDGKIHPNAKQAGTETGRFSYSDPNFQNVPKEDEERFVVRGCIIPSPGNCLVSVDYKQQEFRLLLDYAGEHDLIREINEGADVHTATAKLTGLDRREAKNVGFALLYGAGLDKLASMIGCSKDEAEEKKKIFFSKLPGVKKLMYDVQRAAKLRSYIRNWFGRVCYLHDTDLAYIMVNHLIQGGGADVVKVAMNQLDEINAPMILQVHDELVFDMPPERLDEIPKYMRIMEEVYRPQNGMKLETSCSFSWKSWSHTDKTEGMPK